MTDHADASRASATEPGGEGRPIALVTGATRGIGREVALDLARTHRVIVGGRDARAVAALVEELGDARGFVADLADGAATEAAVETLRADGDGDRLDVLVHSAGAIGPIAPIAEGAREAYREVFELNVVAVADLTRLLLPALRAARGLVIAINSGSGLRAGPESSVYSASKFALLAVTDALRAEERDRGVRVTSIHPGRVATDMQRDLREREGGAYEPERYLDAASVARTVRLAVDLPPSATVESLSIRPSG